MNQDYNQNEFENFLKENAEEYRLYASDSVWKKIHRHIHLKGKIQLAILILLIISTAVTFKIQTSQSTFENRRVTSHLEEFHSINGWGKYFNNSFNTHQLIEQNSESFISLRNSIQPEISANYKTDLYPPTPKATLNSKNASQSVASDTRNFNTIASHSNRAAAMIDFNTNNNLSAAKINAPENIQTTSKDQETAPRVEILENLEIPELVQKNRKNRISWQLSAMPTASFRKLSSVAKQAGRVLNNFPFLSNNPEELVRHRPAIGMELGVHMLYQVSDRIRLKTGVQVNYSKYDINAYSTGRVEPVRIELDGLPSRTYYSYSNFRNFGGEKAELITNQYFQLALPVGIEFTLLKKDNFELAAGGTIQPNYLLNSNSYLISADYKNYAKAPDLIRKFNASTSGEIIVSYSTGGVKWQVGPVVRYQLGSSFIKEYPIREHIIEYGFKIAVSNIIP